MMRAFLCASLAFATFGCQGRTEIVLGVITDLTAPDALDRVHLEVRPTGGDPNADPLLEQDWPIPGVPDQPYILPGSFGLYSSDGSEPRVKILITGFRGSEADPRVTRTSILSLISGQTLFLRQSLVAGCVTNQDCQDSGNQTCVEGRCVDNRIDTHTLPKFQDALLTTVECGATQFRNTGSGAMLTASGTCAAGQFCSEGLCYTPPASMTGAVTWHSLSSGTSADLNAITSVTSTVDGSTVLLAVGAHGAAVRLGELFSPAAGSGWVAENTGAKNDFYGVWGADDTQVFAVGAGGAIYSRDQSGAWTAMDSGTTEDLHAVWGTAANDVFAVGGSHGTGVALHYDGSAWSQHTIPALGELRGVWGLPTGEVWMVGRGGAIAHNVNETFVAVPGAPAATENLTSVFADASAVYLTSSSGALFVSAAGAPFSSVNLGGNSNGLASVYGFPSGDVYAVGSGGAIFHGGADGNFTAEFSDLPQALSAVGGTGMQDLFAVGAGGLLLHSGALPTIPDGGMPPDLSVPVPMPDFGPAACTVATTSTLATNGDPDAGGTPLVTPTGLVWDGAKSLYTLTSTGLTRVDTGSGTGAFVPVNGVALNGLQRLGADTAGNLYLADVQSNVILKLVVNVTSGGYDANFLAGGNASFADGVSDVAGFQTPTAIACDAATKCFVADQGNFAVRVVDTSTGNVTTLAGTGTSGGTDGTGGRTGMAQFGTLTDVTVDRTTGVVYVIDTGNQNVRAIATDGTVTSVAPTNALSIAADGAGHVLLVQNDVLFLLAGSGTTVLAGSVTGHQDSDGCDAQFDGLFGVAPSSDGHTIWLSEQNNNDIRVVSY